MDIMKKLGSMYINEGGKAHFAEAAHTLTFVQISTNAPNSGQCRGSGLVISHQKNYTTEYWSAPSLQEFVQNTIKSYKTVLIVGG